jgi:hypothetical protein
MDGLPAALLAAQHALQVASQREATLRTKLDGLTANTKIKPMARKRKARDASS